MTAILVFSFLDFDFEQISHSNVTLFLALRVYLLSGRIHRPGFLTPILSQVRVFA